MKKGPAPAAQTLSTPLFDEPEAKMGEFVSGVTNERGEV
jgi:hypothetical protein